ncbi:MAG: phosphoribosylanthranilate isomerase [Armatimonadota bacterium]
MNQRSGGINALQLKICGITTIADLRLVAQVGADFFGTIVDIPRSPRNIIPQRAGLLARASTAYSDDLQHVVVVEEPEPDELREMSEVLHPAAFQLHADDMSPESIGALADVPGEDTELWLAVGIPAKEAESAAPVEQTIGRIEAAAGVGMSRVVLDTRTSEGTGGTGRVSDWEAAAEIVAHSSIPVMLAGGITPENVVEAVTTVRPAGIDVSSGVEKAPGRKDPKKVARLAAALRKAQTEE